MKYIAFFDTIEFAHERRSMDLAGANVVEYTAEVLSRLENVDIISPVRTLCETGYYPARKMQLSEKLRLRVPSTFGVRSRVGRLISILWIQLWLFIVMLFCAKRHEKVVVYHSLSTMTIVKILKFIKKFELILEIREVYADVLHLNDYQRKKEYEYFEIADKYIFPTTILNEKVNVKKRPYLIASGIYKEEKRITDRYNDGKIHLVYAGTLDRLKSGALRSVYMASLLNNNYILHILGKGKPETLLELKKEIASISQVAKCEVRYDGELRGENFKRYIQKCHIGLALQDLSGQYNSTSFPSKILTYLANGLEVVSPKIQAIFDSPVGSMLHYYEEDTPKCIADVVRRLIVENNKNSNNRLTILDAKFEKELKQMLYGE